MFNIILTCKVEDLLKNTEELSIKLETPEEAEQLILALWKRVPELTMQQEKELHQLGRKIRKRFRMKPVKI